MLLVPRSLLCSLSVSRLGALVCAGAVASACGSKKNLAEREAMAQSGSADPTATAIDNGYPEPEPKHVTLQQCQIAQAGIEFFPLPIWDFETVTTDQATGETRWVASNMYFYDDRTTWFRVPGPQPGDADSSSWQPSSDEDTTNLCGRSNNHVLHVYGGPFVEWGGGLGRSLKCLNKADTVGRPKIGGTADNQRGMVIERGCDADDGLGACAQGQGDPLMLEACPERDRLVRDEEVDPSDIEEEFLLGMTLDLSAWEGISFWGRRGRNSQAGIRVALGDKYTSDDLSFLQYHINPDTPRYCERNRECGCRNHKQCTRIVTSETVGGPAEGGSYYCVDIADFEAKSRRCTPEKCADDDDDERRAAGCECVELDADCVRVVLPDIHSQIDDGTSTADEDSRHYCYRPEMLFGNYPAQNYRCGPTLCSENYPAFSSFDAQFQVRLQREDGNWIETGKPCTPFAFRGSITEEYCFEPGVDPDPYEALDICGDHWMKGVRLSTEWKFYKVPFTDLLQQGWAKESFWLDLTSAFVVRFTWDRGWIDYYLDDVRFYRHKK
jgi:hypothetical protein